MSIANAVKIAGYAVTGALAGAAVGYFGYKAYMKLSGQSEVQLTKIRADMETTLACIQTVCIDDNVELDNFQMTLVEKARQALLDPNCSYSKLVYYYGSVTDVYIHLVNTVVNARSQGK